MQDEAVAVSSCEDRLTSTDSRVEGLKQLRVEEALTSCEFALRMGISRATVTISHGIWPFAPHIRDMVQNSVIYKPARAGAPYIAALFDPRGQIVASQGFSSHDEAEAFIQAFMQENAGEHELPLSPHISGR